MSVTDERRASIRLLNLSTSRGGAGTDASADGTDSNRIAWACSAGVGANHTSEATPAAQPHCLSDTNTWPFDRATGSSTVLLGPADGMARQTARRHAHRHRETNVLSERRLGGRGSASGRSERNSGHDRGQRGDNRPDARGHDSVG